jgi:hypothetical protein
MPPYLVVGINGTDVTHLLPPKIPLNVALHFIPNLQEWVLHLHLHPSFAAHCANPK